MPSHKSDPVVAVRALATTSSASGVGAGCVIPDRACTADNPGPLHGERVALTMGSGVLRAALDPQVASGKGSFDRGAYPVSRHSWGGGLAGRNYVHSHGSGECCRRKPPYPRQAPELWRLVRREFMRNCVTRATPAMATTTPPPTAAISNAIPSGREPARPK
jgi:hypothetical protein